MIVTFLGTGTSQGIPLIGCHCTVCNSNDIRDKRLRTSLAVAYNSGHLVIDVGPDFRQQMLKNQVQNLHGILLTHEHNDHVAGLDDIRPFNFKQGGALTIYALPRVAADLKRRFEYVFSTQQYPGAPQVKIIELEAFRPISVAGLTILPVEVVHGSLSILGFRFNDFTYITDANHLSPRTKAAISGTRWLVLNALHHNKHHSHYNLAEAIEQADEINADQTYFTHISHRMGAHEKVCADLPQGISLAFDGLQIHVS